MSDETCEIRVGDLRDILNNRGLRYQVHEFHEAMGQPVLHTPQVPSEERVRLRLRLIAEEFFELLAASVVDHKDNIADAHDLVLRRISPFYSPSEIKVNLPEFIDALADLDYVIEGTRLEFGVDGWPIAQEVHRANMAKVGGAVDEHGKITKPEGWEPPDIAGELRKQGWES